MPETNKILIITYYWPPCGGAGVQRWLKFTRYMPENGWKPFVLTVDPAFAQYPAIDSSLEKDIHPDTVVHKTKAVNYFKLGGGSSKSVVPGAGFATGSKNIFSKIARFTRGNLFIPDPRKGWNNHAIKKAVEIIKKEDISYVVTTSPPHSTQLIGLALKKRLPGIKWISDLRDPWTDIYYYREFYGTPPARAYDKKLERRVLREADKIITVGNSLASLFMEKDASVKEKISVITNGYDEEDFKAGKDLGEDKDLEITYVGSMSDRYPVEPFIEALNSICEDRDDFRFRVKIVGSVSPGIKNMISNYGIIKNFVFLPYCDHAESVNHVLDSNLLLLLIPDHPMNRIIITGKIFEYLRSMKPVLCIGPAAGDASEILIKNKAGNCFNINDISGIKSFILGKHKMDNNKNEISKFSHRKIVKTLLEEII